MDVKTKRTKLHEAFPYLRETNLHHWKRVQHTLDAHHTRAQMLEYRKKILEAVQEEAPVEVKVEEPPPPPPPPPPVVVEEPVEEPPKKNVKTVELVECEKCGKKLTQRTLKYSHPAVCPKNDPPPESTQKPKKQRSTVEAPPQEVEAPQTLGMVRRVRKMKGIRS